MADILEVAEGLRYQTSDETRIYTITTTNVVSSPTSPTVVGYDEATETDVSATIMPSGSHSATGDVITLKPITALTKKHTYRIEVKWVVGSQTYERYFRIYCSR